MILVSVAAGFAVAAGAARDGVAWLGGVALVAAIAAGLSLTVWNARTP